VRQVLVVLAEAGLLETFFTTVAAVPGTPTAAFAQLPGLSTLARRSYPSALRSRIRCFPMREAVRLLCERAGWGWPIRHERGVACIDQVFRSLDRHTARYVLRRRPQVVYAYEDGAVASFRAACQVEATRIYDLPIGYWRSGRRIMAEEAECRPDWAVSMDGLDDSPAKLERKDEELALAEHVVVASSFTRATLVEAKIELPPISVIPYGADDPLLDRPLRDRDTTRPLRVLYVGALTQRKGVADLLDAVRLAGSAVRLTLIGRRPPQACAPLDRALAAYRWHPSLPRQSILQQMAEHDVLVFPSLFEGFGLVITEALSQGVPVITTPHTCGPDLLTDGVDGFLVPIRDPEAIAAALILLHEDRDRLECMSQAARRTAERHTWARYRAESVALVSGLLAAQR
jgi:glycosyltransferase involved in cell wall biosynthesis